MDLGNPFALSYLTEASLTPKELLDRYSFKPFDVVHEALASRENVFLVGRKGVGKTMLLRVFDPEMMGMILRGESEDAVRVRDLLPRAAIGLYVNLGSPGARVTQFRGAAEGAQYWREAFADYLNWVLLLQLINAIRSLCHVPMWKSRAGVLTDDSLESRSVVAQFLALLREESSAFDGVGSLDELWSLSKERVLRWTRYVNRDEKGREPPPGRLPLAAPLFRFTEATRHARACQYPVRIFVLIDQYEILHQERSVIDFRPMFNRAMYSASRGGTGVEFKIGTRKYAIGGLEMPDAEGRLEASREFVELNLDEESGRFYGEFARELFAKRMRESVSAGGASMDPSRLLPRLSALNEAKLYVGRSSGNIPDYLAPYATGWKRAGVPEMGAETIFSRADLASRNPLVAAIVCIAMTRWFASDRAVPPPGCDRYPSEAHDFGAEYARTLAQLVEERYQSGSRSSEGGSPALRAVDFLARDVEDAALFQLASFKKNRRRRYSGFERLVDASSNVAVVFIELMRAAYDWMRMGGHQRMDAPVPVEAQSEAMYRVSEAWFSRVRKDYDYGETHYRFLRGFGAAMRQLQLDPAVHQPSPNGVSVTLAQEDFEAEGLTPREDALAVIRDAISWGLLERTDHNDKGRGRAKRMSIRMNRIFCPYFQVSMHRKKDPMYVADLRSFVAACQGTGIPSEVRRRLDFTVDHGESPDDGGDGPLFRDVGRD